MPCYLHAIVALPFIIFFLVFIYLSNDEYLSNDSLSILNKYPNIRYFLYLPLLLLPLLLIDIFNLNYVEHFCDLLIDSSSKFFLDLLANLIIYIIYPIIFIILFDFIFLNSIVAKIKKFVLPIQFYKEEISRDTLFFNKNKLISLNDAPKSELAYILSTNYRFNEHGINNLALVVNFIWLLELYKSTYKKFFYPFVLAFVSFLFYLSVIFFYFNQLFPSMGGKFSFVLFSIFWSLYTIVWLKKLFGLTFFTDTLSQMKTSIKNKDIASEIDYLTLYEYDSKSGSRENATDRLRLFFKEEISKKEEKELEAALTFMISVFLAVTITILLK